jgi:hypothetical protein
VTEGDEFVGALGAHDAGDDGGIEHRALGRAQAVVAQRAATLGGNLTRDSATAVRLVDDLSLTSTMVGRCSSSRCEKVMRLQPPM